MRPKTPYETITTLAGGGLNVVDAPDLLAEGEARELNNFGFAGRGRVTPRKAATVVSTIPGQVVGIVMFPHGSYQTADLVTRYVGVVYLTWFENRVDLYVADGVGQNPKRMGMLAGWSPVSAKPRISAAVVNRKLFVCDVGQQLGLTVFDPFHPLATADTQSLFYQPSFVFDPLYAPGKATPRTVVAYNNFLLMAGYGTQGEPSRPEMVRFSYLGLFDDGEGAGDAGYAANPAAPTQREVHENKNLFDLEDYFMVGERGTPVVTWAPALGRLVMATPYNAWVLFGYDRDSFQLELLDNTRGCAGDSAMLSAHGMVYWWSPMGPVRWNGSMVEEVGEKIRDEVDLLKAELVVAAHVRTEKEVRFYQGRRGFSFNYEKGQWSRITLPTGFDVWCAGGVSPYTSTNTGAAAPRVGPGGKTDPTDEKGAPSALTHEDITQNTATSTWANGDTSPDVKTLVWRKKTADALFPDLPVATLAPGENRFAHTGLEPNTGYDVRVAHEKNEIRSSYATGSFTTRALASVPAPEKFRVLNDPILRTNTESGGGSNGGAVIPVVDPEGNQITWWQPSALLRWDVAATRATTQVYRALGDVAAPNRQNPDFYTLVYETGMDEATWRDQDAALAPGEYYTYLIRHFQNGNYSGFAPAVTVLLGGERPPPTKPGSTGGTSGGGSGTGGGGGSDGEWGGQGEETRLVAEQPE